MTVRQPHSHDIYCNEDNRRMCFKNNIKHREGQEEIFSSHLRRGSQQRMQTLEDCHPRALYNRATRLFLLFRAFPRRKILVKLRRWAAIAIHFFPILKPYASIYIKPIGHPHPFVIVHDPLSVQLHNKIHQQGNSTPALAPPPIMPQDGNPFSSS